MTVVATALSAEACVPSRAALVNELNTGKPAGAQLAYQGEIHFGPAMRVQRFALGNGLRVLVLEDHGAPVVTYHTWFRVGSRDEKPGKTGLAHLFEHLMFNETKSLAAGEFDKILERNGAESNAATWMDWTYYHEKLPASKLEVAARLESDRMANLVLREKQVSSEKEVVANERRYRVDDDVEGSVGELLFKTAFTAHPYHWPTIGWMEDIQAFTTDDCEAFYKTYYAPNNATVVVVGDFAERDVLALVQLHYGAIAASTTLPTRAYPAEPEQTAERRLEVKKPTANEKLMLGYKSPALDAPDHVQLTVLNEILFGGRSSRVYRALVKQRELATDIRGWVGTFAEAGIWEMYLTAREGHSALELEQALDGLLAEIIAKEVPAEELEKAKSRLELAFLQGMETVSGKAEQIGFYETVLGDPGAAFVRLEAYRAVTVDDVRRAAKTWLDVRRRTTIHVLPDGSADAADGEGDDEEGDDEEGAVARAPARPGRAVAPRKPWSSTRATARESRGGAR
jgi:zinc protease